MVNFLKFNNSISEKMACANIADPDQIALDGAVWLLSTLVAIPLSIRKQLHKKQSLGKKYGMKCLKF